MNPNIPRMLGRTASPFDNRTLNLRRYTTAKVADPPVDRLWQQPVNDWGVMGNDRHGNCTTVTAAHIILAWRANELNDTKRISDNAVIELAREIGGLNGFSILERLRLWRKRQFWATALWAFVDVNPQDQREVAIAINSFGAADVGVNLPNAWRSADVWDTGEGAAYRPGSWGSHSVPLVGYNANYVYAVTWGEVVAMTWAAVERYCDEAYALLSPDWLAQDSASPSGFDLCQLHADLHAIDDA